MRFLRFELALLVARFYFAALAMIAIVVAIPVFVLTGLALVAVTSALGATGALASVLAVAWLVVFLAGTTVAVAAIVRWLRPVTRTIEHLGEPEDEAADWTAPAPDRPSPAATLAATPSPLSTFLEGRGEPGWAAVPRAHAEDAADPAQAAPTRQSATAARVAGAPGVGSRRWETLSRQLAVVLVVAGPPFAVMFAIAGLAGPTIVVFVGSFAAAGLLLAVSGRGIRGALVALVLPIAWAVLAVVLMIWDYSAGSLTTAEQPQGAAVFGAVVLIAVAAIEAGYLVGRFTAWVIRMRQRRGRDPGSGSDAP